MGNSSMVVYTKISPNKNSPRNAKIDKITIHHMAGNCSIETCGNIFAPTSRKASSNYGIDSNGRVGMYVEEKDRSWCSSNSANDHRAITIEVADDTNKAPWHSSKKAMSTLILLCADICRRNGIGSLNYTGDKNGNLTLHKWFTSTSCPGEYLESMMPKIANEVNNLLKSGATTYEWTEGTEIQAKKPVSASSATNTNNSSTSLRKGDKGDSVKDLQRGLNQIMNAGLEVDGSFGKLTENAVKEFQKKYSLTIDGIFGKNSKAKMNELLNATSVAKTTNVPYLVRINTDLLNVRKEPNANSKIVTTVTRGNVYTIVEEIGDWGRLKSGVGFISLNYVIKL